MTRRRLHRTLGLGPARRSPRPHFTIAPKHQTAAVFAERAAVVVARRDVDERLVEREVLRAFVSADEAEGCRPCAARRDPCPCRCPREDERRRNCSPGGETPSVYVLQRYRSNAFLIGVRPALVFTTAGFARCEHPFRGDVSAWIGPRDRSKATPPGPQVIRSSMRQKRGTKRWRYRHALDASTDPALLGACSSRLQRRAAACRRRRSAANSTMIQIRFYPGLFIFAAPSVTECQPSPGPFVRRPDPIGVQRQKS